jgi:hypothetical protein
MPRRLSRSRRVCTASRSREVQVVSHRLAQQRLRSRSRTAEEQNIAVSVLEFESTQAVIGIFEWFKELDIARREFRRQCVRIRDVKMTDCYGIQPGKAAAWRIHVAICASSSWSSSRMSR